MYSAVNLQLSDSKRFCYTKTRRYITLQNLDGSLTCKFQYILPLSLFCDAFKGVMVSVF